MEDDTIAARPTRLLFRRPEPTPASRYLRTPEGREALMRAYPIFRKLYEPAAPPANAKEVAAKQAPAVAPTVAGSTARQTAPAFAVALAVADAPGALEPVKRPPSKRASGRKAAIDLDRPGYLRLEDVLAIFPVSRAAWYEGVKDGVYPSPVALGKRSVGYRIADIKALLESPSDFAKGNSNG